MANGGRHTDKERQEKQALVLTKLRAGVSIRGACGLARISFETFYNWKKDAAFLLDYDEAMGFLEEDLLNKLKEEKGPAWVKYMTLLERKWPAMYGTKLPTVAEMTKEELQRLADVLRSSA